jgi:hypothetical protein
MAVLDEEEALNPTTRFSVATLRDLIVRSADMSGKLPEGAGAPAELALPPMRPSVPTLDVLVKGTPVLVFPEPPSVSTTPPESSTSVSLPSVIIEDMKPAAATAWPAPTALRPRPKRDTMTAVEGFLKCRLIALLLLAFAVSAPPWWWNIGDVRPPHALMRAHAAQAPLPASQ